ncbi:MAG: hypothetical protein K2N15_00905 [Lachnospiraceae bacterium]|nr:hypothetical protein [Lachnospiraceae bacterium]
MKKRKKNGAAVLVCSILLAVSFGILAGCSITEENMEGSSGSSETKNILDENSKNSQLSPETFPIGRYHDDMGSELSISKADDKNYSIDFGIYKSFYVEDAVGSYDDRSGVLSFSGTDLGTENTISADVTIQGDHLLVTLTQSEYLTGETFEFEPGQP